MDATWIIGNWKMNGSREAVTEFFSSLLASPLPAPSAAKLVVLVPFPYLAAAQEARKSQEGLFIGAQNVDVHESGPYTGEISAQMLADHQVTYCLVGHSERREWHHETEHELVQKCERLQAAHVTPILCFGENIAQKQSGQSLEVCYQQVSTVLRKLSEKQSFAGVLAYEPVWAIGSGSAAEIDEVKRLIQALRRSLAREDSAGSKLPILYGGSVSDKNAGLFLSCPDLNGVLVGNASLQAKSFAQILACIPQHSKETP